MLMEPIVVRIAYFKNDPKRWSQSGLDSNRGLRHHKTSRSYPFQNGTLLLHRPLSLQPVFLCERRWWWAEKELKCISYGEEALSPTGKYPFKRTSKSLPKLSNPTPTWLLASLFASLKSYSHWKGPWEIKNQTFRQYLGHAGINYLG